jgi:5'-methylthioadenosine phosphorylase
VTVHRGADFVFVRRHGEGLYHPPHRIPHHAHVLALEALGVGQVVAFASSGSLHEDVLPGDLIVPEDYLSCHDPPTFAADDYLHVVPTLDAGCRNLLLQAAERTLAANALRAPSAATLWRGGVYAETRGPRFETRAEVRMLAPHARVVGMTAASEATLFQERGIGYAMICTVDNWANGIGGAPLTVALFESRLARNSELVRRIMSDLLALWREAGEE